MTYADWPLFDLWSRCREVELRPVREADLPELAALEPEDAEPDPRLAMLPGLTDRQNKQRLFHQGYWRALGTWSPQSWVLHLAVRHEGALVGVQTLEGDDFPELRTVDSASWLIPGVRGRGLGVAMRTAALGLAFDHLGALAAITSAALDNQASLGVSRRIGYRDNGLGFVHSREGRLLLRHLRLPADEWTRGAEVEAGGVAPCLPWFGLA
ncbi:GNAT family N-acetyltransferase [Actinoplanes sp. NPDC049265]|uniref:GNAT family N-acetyltransferase n=1 Tax=Actinoplanes sp. NPDC049265 TaxID=3363902 RepID=UPI00371690A3